MELSFTYGYGCCVFQHNICGNQLKAPDCISDSSNFLSLECLASLRCPLVSASSKDASSGVHCREVAEKSGKGAPLGDLNKYPLFFFFFFFLCNGPNVATLLLPSFFRSGPKMAALLLHPFFVVAQIWLLGHISSCN